MLVDEVEIKVQAGRGGDGKASFFPGRKSGPDGGNGGNGGDIYAKLSPHISSLNRYASQKIYKAEDGGVGGNFLKYGKGAEDLMLPMPPGTFITNIETGTTVELTNNNNPLLFAKGGEGGRGNASFKSSLNTSPRQADPGQEGEQKIYQIVMKLIADYGLIGLPNAGKSSLLNRLTAAQAKIAGYPFTTLEPNLGAFDKKIIADIPGLIEGASQGKGLGIKFLKHIEKVALLFHCVAADSLNIEKDYQTVRKELKEFSPSLIEKKEIVLLTKVDLIDSKEKEHKLELLKKNNPRVMPISIYLPETIESLKKIISLS